MWVALSLPTIRYETLGSPEEVYSILGGIQALWEDGTPFLGLIVFAFSLVLPAFKLGVAGTIVSRGSATPWSARWIRRLHAAGRWSTLDFWVVGLFVSAIQLGVTRSETRPGIHLFLLAMLAGILATRVIERDLGRPMITPRPPRSRLAWVSAPAMGRAVHLLGALCLLGAPTLTLLSVRKGILKEHAFSLEDAVLERGADGEIWLAGGLLVFMVLVPLARAAVAGMAHWARGRPAPRLLGLEAELGRWCMLDVLALALVIVASKLEDLATLSIGPAAGFVAAAAAFKAADAALLRRRVEAAASPSNVPR